MRVLIAIACVFFSGTVHAQNASQVAEAKWMLERLTGVKWAADAPQLADMAVKIAAGDKVGAAAVATAQPQFISVTVKEMAAKMSTREETVREPLNDFSATIMGATRDGLDFRTVLYGDYLYKGDQSKLTGQNVPDDVLRNNLHYSTLETKNVNITDVLIKVDGQKIATSNTASVASPDPAGVLTSRAFLAAHAIAGTNRRLVEYTFRQFMCLPILGWSDTSSFDTRVGRDIDRAPGGDPTTYLTTCKGCHTGMDGFRGAFAKWDFRDIRTNESVALHASNGVTSGNYQPDLVNGVSRKMNRPDFIQYAGGYVTTDDSFINNTNRPGSVNATRFGWRAPAPDASALASRTTGVHALGRLISNSMRFQQCMAQRVWDSVCKHTLSDGEVDAVMVSLGQQFEAQSFNMKKLFELVAAHPKCRI